MKYVASVIESVTPPKGGHSSKNLFKIFVGISLFVLGVILGLIVFFQTYGKCSMSSKLKPLITNSLNKLEQLNITYWLDAGTLLGAVRDHDVIAFDFDADIGMPPEVCKKMSTKEVRDAFAAIGYQVFDRKDYIPYKYTPLLDDGYIHAPCARIYDGKGLLYVDIYAYVDFQFSQLRPTETNPHRPYPSESDRAKPWLCNMDHDLHDSEVGCRPYDAIYPLQKQPGFLGMKHVWIPSDPEYMFTLMYGLNWRIPIPKGYKLLVCSPTPLSVLLSYLVLFSLVSICLYVAVQVKARSAAAAATASASLRPRTDILQALELGVDRAR